MIISEVLVVAFLIVCCITLIAVQLDDHVIEKDLYNVLGIPSHATLAEVKKSFRKLAQQYHPDKAKPGSSHESGKQFQEISEAYDILSSRELREEYDSRRFQKTIMQQEDIHYSTLDENTLYYEPEFYFPNDFIQHRDEYYFNTASIVGSVLHRGQVMFPYDEILTSSTGSYFALLDGSCSLVVYHGDVHEFASYVQYMHNVYTDPFTQSSPQQRQYKEIYRSEQFHYLQGRCAAVLDYFGVFHICVRDSFGEVGESLWSTAASSGSSDLTADVPYNSNYNLQLRNDGTLEIVSIYQPSPWEHVQYVCIWSTVSCNRYIASTKRILTTLQSSLKKVFSIESIIRLKRIVRETLSVIKKAVVDILFKVRTWLQEYSIGRESNKDSVDTPADHKQQQQQQKGHKSRSRGERVR